MKRSLQASPSSIPSSSSFMSVLDALALEAAGSRAGLGQEDTTSLLIGRPTIVYLSESDTDLCSRAERDVYGDYVFGSSLDRVQHFF